MHDRDVEILQERIARLSANLAVIRVGAPSEVGPEGALPAHRGRAGGDPGGDVRGRRPGRRHRAAARRGRARRADARAATTRAARRSSATCSASRCTGSPPTPATTARPRSTRCARCPPGHGLNALTGEFGDLFEKGVIDPVRVTRLVARARRVGGGAAADHRGARGRGADRPARRDHRPGLRRPRRGHGAALLARSSPVRSACGARPQAGHRTRGASIASRERRRRVEVVDAHVAAMPTPARQRVRAMAVADARRGAAPRPGRCPACRSRSRTTSRWRGSRSSPACPERRGVVAGRRRAWPSRRLRAAGRDLPRQDQPAALGRRDRDRQRGLRAHQQPVRAVALAWAGPAAARPPRSPRAARRSGSAPTRARASRLPAHFCGLAALKPTAGRVPVTGVIDDLGPVGPAARPAHADRASSRARSPTSRSCSSVIEDRPRRDRRRPACAHGRARPARGGARRRRARDARRRRPRASSRAAAAALARRGRASSKRRRAAGRRPRAHRARSGRRTATEAISYDLLRPLGRATGRDAALRRALRRDPLPRLPDAPRRRTARSPNLTSYTTPHNLTGWPAATVRCGTSADGLPIGVQVAAHLAATGARGGARAERRSAATAARRTPRREPLRRAAARRPSQADSSWSDAGWRRR